MTTNYIKHVNCDLCGKDNSEKVLEKSGTFYVRCKECGFVYMNPRRGDSDLENENFQVYGDALPKYAGKYSPKNQSIYRRRLRYFSKYRKLNRILEIGCNAGAFLYQAQKMGWDCQGVEPVRDCTNYARDKYGLDVIPDILENAMLPENSFDVVYSNAVFEHLPHPTSVLLEIARVLRPGGMVYTNTVNYDCYTRELLGKDWKLLHPDGHLSLYTPVTLTCFHKKAGLEVLKIQSRGVRSRKEDMMILRDIKKFYQSCLSRVTLKGDRIIIIARKNNESKGGSFK